MEFIGVGLLYGLAVLGAGIGIGLIGYGASTATARQPEMQGSIFTTFIIGAAMIEALALIGFVLVLILQGKIA